MAALEHRVITGILHARSMVDAMSAGLVDKAFKDAEARQIYKFIYRWWHNAATKKTVPTIAAIRRKWPSFEPTARDEDEDGSLKSLIHELKMRAYDSDIRGLATYFQDLVDEDPENAIIPLKKRLDDLSYRVDGGTHLGLLGIIDHAEDHYDAAQSGDIYGIPWPWDPLTQDTLGKLKEKFIVFYGRMKSMKCVCTGQRIMLADGSLVPIEEVPEETAVPSYTAETGKVRLAKAKRVVSGTKDCVEVTTRSGLRLRTGDKHLYMVPGGGYKRICDLTSGDYVATARRLPKWEPATGSIKPKDAHLLGLLVGDGNYTRNELQFTTADEELLNAMQGHVARHGCSIHETARGIEYRIVGPGKGMKNPLLELVRNEGIHGQKSPSKRVPARVFSSKREAIASFLAGMLDTDGTVGAKFVAWSSSSRGLLGDLQHLLMRLGVRGRLKEVVTNYGTLAYQLYVYSKENASVLCEQLGPYLCLSYKKEALHKLAHRDCLGKRNVDGVPYTKELFNEILSAKGDNYWPKTGISKFSRGKVFTQKGNISRKLLNKLADAFDSETLRHEANTDIIWEQIDTIESIGKLPCYDICIEDGQDPNFVVEGFIVHNSWLMLYCAAVDFQEHHQRVLIWSREMEEGEIALRLASIFGKVDYQLLKKGKLPPKLEKRAFKVLQELKDMRSANLDALSAKDPRQRSDIIIMAGHGAPKTVDELRGAISTYQPDVVYVDSFYHLHTDRASGNQRWLQVATLAEDLKAMAQDFQIPIIATTQANREGDKSLGRNMSEVADSDNIAREADLMIRVIKRKGRELHEKDYEAAKKTKPAARVKKGRRMQLRIPNKKRKKSAQISDAITDALPRVGAELALILGANRDGILEAFSIHAIPGYNFKIINASFASDEIQEWVDKDNKKIARDRTKMDAAKNVSSNTFNKTKTLNKTVEE